MSFNQGYGQHCTCHFLCELTCIIFVNKIIIYELLTCLSSLRSPFTNNSFSVNFTTDEKDSRCREKKYDSSTCRSTAPSSNLDLDD